MEQNKINLIAELWKKHAYLTDCGYGVQYNNFWKAIEEYDKSFPVELPVKPACGNCINCIHFVDIDIQKDLQSACTHKNITVAWVENPEEFGCTYFESKSV